MKPDEITKRINNLTPEKRKLMERLLAEKGLKRAIAEGTERTTDVGPEPAPVKRSTDVDEANIEVPGITPGLTSDFTDLVSKNDTRNRYNAYHRKCNSTVYGDHSWFMNLGYSVDENTQYAKVPLPDQIPNKNSVKLALEVLGDCELSGRKILDVGCGRGGTIYLIQTHYKPIATVGLDLSTEGIAYCNRIYDYENSRYINGDAENLPFADESFDIVTNIESSHNYPNRFAFYDSVYRVLRPGGFFLYSDVLPVEMLQEAIEYLIDLGFEVERDRNITSNVMKSCEQTAELQFDAFASSDTDDWMANALGIPGSRIYEGMKAGVTNCRIYKLRKQ